MSRETSTSIRPRADWIASPEKSRLASLAFLTSLERRVGNLDESAKHLEGLSQVARELAG